MTEILESNRFGSISIDQIIKFEDDSSIKLPDDYKSFLLNHNGGKPKPNNNKTPETDVQRIYGIHNGDYWASLEWHMSTFENRIPKNSLPIAGDSLGNLFILSLRQESFGEIWFWDHENETENIADEYFDNITQTAKSFKEFIDNLYEWIDDKESETDKILRTNDMDSLTKLINSDYNLNELDKYNRSLIENAVIKNRYEMVKLLAEKGADIRKSIEFAEKNHHFFPNNGFDKIIDYLNARKKNKWQFWKS